MGRSNLQKHLAKAQGAVRELPGAAASELGQLATDTHRRQLAPDGTRWERTKEGAPFDAQGHIVYRPVVEGDQVKLVAEHRAARFARWGTRYMRARPGAPTGDDLGWWLPRLLKRLRGALRKGGIG